MVFYGFLWFLWFFMVFIFFRLNAASAMNSRKEFSRLCFSRRLRKTPTAASAKGTNTKIILKLFKNYTKIILKLKNNSKKINNHNTILRSPLNCPINS